MKREINIGELQTTKQWDIIVIGGGATGLGIGVDASTRGFKTLVLEQYDFAKGTSSKSTKLVHGGVRYLANGDISLVLEALKERGLLLKNAPHLAKNQKFIIPNYDWWGGSFYTVGLKLYDAMAGKLGLGPSEYINKNEVLKEIPNLNKEGLQSGVIYYDGQFDDARLAINLAQTINDNNSCVLNYADVIGFIKNDINNIIGVKIEDKETNKIYDIYSKMVINATGIFTDNILKLDNIDSEKTIMPSRGIHIVLDKKFNIGDSAIMIPKTSDGRVVFAVPWHNKLIVGTTDNIVDDIEIEPKATNEEITFLLETLNRYLLLQASEKDILSVFAGLRPLVLPDNTSGSTKDVSRSHKITISESGLISIFGGKWTTYRKMAEETVDKAIIIAGLSEKKCQTENMPIHGYVKNFNEKERLHFYGADAIYIKEIMRKNKKLAKKISDDFEHYKAEVIWSVRHEMCRTVEDFLARRTRCLLLDAKASIKVAPIVAELIAGELNYDKSWVNNQIEEYKKLAENYLPN